MERAAVRIRVMQGDRDVEGAYVRLLDAADEFVAEYRSRINGLILFVLPQGAWRLICLAPVGKRVERSFTVAGQEPLDITLQVPAQASPPAA